MDMNGHNLKVLLCELDPSNDAEPVSISGGNYWSTSGDAVLLNIREELTSDNIFLFTKATTEAAGAERSDGDASAVGTSEMLMFSVESRMAS